MSIKEELFQDEEIDGRTIRHRNRKATTFKGGLNRLAHRWFRLTPSFSPELVTTLLDEFGSANSKVLDPFSGRGTTPIECQLHNIRCVGIEINPILHFAGKTSLEWSINPKEASEIHNKIISGFSKDKLKLTGANAEEVATALKVGFPAIFNVHRWWRDEVLCDLLILKSNIYKKSSSDEIRDLFLLALTNILLDAANITLGRLQLHFIDRTSDEIIPLELYKISVGKVLMDLSDLVSYKTTSGSTIHHGDTRFLSQYVGDEKFDLVITSPPYPNRYSYVWNTRPHLYFMDMFENSKQAGDLDSETIGGTWGTATSRHGKVKFEYSNKIVEDVVNDIVEEIREKDLLMSNYVAMYFDDMYRHIVELKKCLKSGAICAYVVGNSRIKKSMVDTDLLLNQLFLAVGFKEVRLEQIRKRNSGKELHETIVIVENA